jgi:tRNA nucleotidyltransferase (CCA-adding enzyme)
MAKVAVKQTLDTEDMSSEDPAVQTVAVEKLINNTVRTKLPKWKDKVFAVGGFVRDSLLGKSADDLDLVADDPEFKMQSGKELAEQLAKALNIETPNNPHVLDQQFEIYGLILAHPKKDGKRERFITPDGVDVSGYKLEITPPRKESEYDNKRRPKSVEYTSREEDALRRDLTVNSLLKNITGDSLENSEKNIEDYSGGLEDLKKGILRKPSHPGRGDLDIYFDDPLRILRLVRFKGKMPGFKIDPSTERDAKKFMLDPEGRSVFETKVSAERITAELKKILTLPSGKDAREGIERMQEYGLLDYVSPTLSKLIDVKHDEVFHIGESGFEHTMNVLEGSPSDLEVRMAALLHDIGKVSTHKYRTQYFDKSKSDWINVGDGGAAPEGAETRDRHSFPGHEDVSARESRKILKDLKFDSKESETIIKLVHSHMGLSSEDPDAKDDEGRKKFLYKARVLIEALYDSLDYAIALMKADMVSKDDRSGDNKKLERIFDELQRLKKEDTEKGLIKPSGSGGYKYKYPVTVPELSVLLSSAREESAKKKFERDPSSGEFSPEKIKAEVDQILKGPAVGALLDYLKVEAMKNPDISKEDISKILKNKARTEAALKQLITEYKGYKSHPSFYPKFSFKVGSRVV